MLYYDALHGTAGAKTNGKVIEEIKVVLGKKMVYNMQHMNLLFGLVYVDERE